jgi:hypothetical protein
MTTLTKVGIGIAALPVAFIGYQTMSQVGQCDKETANGKVVKVTHCTSFGEALGAFGQTLFMMAMPTYLLPHKSDGDEDWSGMMTIFTIPFYLGVGLAIWGARK